MNCTLLALTGLSLSLTRTIPLSHSTHSPDLEMNRGGRTMSLADESEGAPTPPVPPDLSSVPADDCRHDLEMERLRAFVGSKGNYYLNRWMTVLRGWDDAGFNWAAFFWSGLWLGYRKM